MYLPAGTQTTVVGAAAGAAVGASVDYFVGQRGQLREGGMAGLAKSGAIGATTGALAVNFMPQRAGLDGPRTRSNAFNFGAGGFFLGLGYSVFRDTDNIIRNLAIGSVSAGILGYLTDQYGLLGRFGRSKMSIG